MDDREQCVYCGHREYEPGWGCHACGLVAPEDDLRWREIVAAAPPADPDGIW